MSQVPEMAFGPVSQADVETRAAFISKTYYHVLGAIGAFTGIEIFFFKSGMAESITKALVGSAGSWLIVLGAFMLVGWLASRIAHVAESMVAQYAALTAYVVAEAVIFAPLLFIADRYAKGGTIESAASVTLIGFVALTAIAFITRKDFSALRGLLIWGGVIALLLIVGGAIFGFQLGLYFSVGMVALAGASILYDTSNIIHHYPQDRYVGASLQLFASVTLLFWYVLRIYLSSRD